ncbi:hypothetical protein Tco_0686665 [Tanacetum coccineum]
MPKSSIFNTICTLRRSDWDLLFQPMFDESLNPSTNVDLQAPEVIAPIPEAVAPEHAVSTGSLSSTTVDQDAPSPSNSHTTQETQTPIISHDVEEDNHDIEVAHMGNDPYFGILIPEVTSDQSSSSDLGWSAVLSPRGGYRFRRVIRSGCKIRGYMNFSSVCCSHEHGHLSNGCEDCVSEWTQLDPTLLSCESARNFTGTNLCDDIIFAASTPVLGCDLFAKNNVFKIQDVDDGELPMVWKSKLDEEKDGESCRSSHTIVLVGENELEFLINKLGMRSFTPDTLKQLTDEVDE